MTYPNLFRRYVATLLDLLVLWFGIYGITRLPVVGDSGWGMPVAAVAVAVLYEPLFTSRACTLGQVLMRIRVRTNESLKRIPIHMAYMRVCIKYLLGAISVLTIPARLDRRAIHDLAVDSIVVDASEVSGRAAKLTAGRIGGTAI